MSVGPTTSRPPVSTSAVPPAIGFTRGRAAHARAAQRLVDSYRALPAGAPVRLAKRTSNLFRPRSGALGPGLDVTGLDGVVEIDTAARTADVQGMCTYEQLVAATLPKGLAPLVVPQLRTITLGGAVTGLGIESTSLRNGLPHESVLELDVLTGSGELVTATPDGEHSDLYAAFPNSYGSLGYASRLRIELEPVDPYVDLRIVPFTRLSDLTGAIGVVASTGGWDGVDVDYVDGVVFARDEGYLVLGRRCAEPDAPPSDYTGDRVFYRELRRIRHDVLTVHDYLWRWDTDWFWCSRALGAQHPAVRRVWPARLRRSDVYHRIVGLENRYGVVARLDAARGRPARERVVQDVEVPLAATEEFLTWFLDRVGMSPVWLCPLRLRRDGPRPAGSPADLTWPLYPLRTGQVYVNVGFWGTVPIAPGAADGDVNRDIEQRVAALAGHKSLYSDAYYDEDTFWATYGGDGLYRRVRDRYDPDHRLTDLYAKAVGRR